MLKNAPLFAVSTGLGMFALIYGVEGGQTSTAQVPESHVSENQTASKQMEPFRCQSKDCTMLVQSLEKGLFPEFASAGSTPTLMIKAHEITSIEQSGTQFNVQVGRCTHYVKFACLKNRPCGFYDLQESRCIRY